MNRLVVFWPYLLVLFCMWGYGFLAQEVHRFESGWLIGLFSLLFVGYYLLVKQLHDWKVLIAIGAVFRLLFLSHVPELSPDFYRFLWDGHFQLIGGNPFTTVPNTVYHPDLFPLAKQLFDGMGHLHQSYPSNYPPLSQLMYRFTAYWGGDLLAQNIGVLRLLQWTAEIGTLVAGLQLLKHWRLPLKNIGWYFLNPLVILEITGNLHAEVWLCCFIGWGLVALVKKKSLVAGLFFGTAVAAKLLPLLLLPLIVRHLKIRKTLHFAIGFVTIVGLWILPFWSPEMVENYWNTLGLWFYKFEFNASFYYLYRWMGYQLLGYNAIAYWGKVVPIVIFLSILSYSFFKPITNQQRLITKMLWVLAFYWFVATTVHPWYLVPLIFVGIFTPYRFWVLWSCTAFWSYAAYGKTDVQENTTLLIIGYLSVLGYLLYEKKAKAFVKN